MTQLWREWRGAFRRRTKAALPAGPRLEEIASLETLAEAWSRVRANKGAPGRDGVTIEAFEASAERGLERLRASLLSERYRPSPPRPAVLRKPGGGSRRLAIPAVVDRIAQTAALIAIEPHVDGRMSEASWAYRPGRSVERALAAVAAARARGLAWTVDADIADFFDSVPHRRLKTELAIWFDDERILRLIGRWLRVFGLRGKGVAQGAPLSPLLANLYLHPLDRQLGAEGACLVRYADDFVILARSEGHAKAALREVAARLAHRGLRLHAGKTRIVAPGGPCPFLGREIGTADQTPAV